MRVAVAAFVSTLLLVMVVGVGAAPGFLDGCLGPDLLVPSQSPFSTNPSAADGSCSGCETDLCDCLGSKLNTSAARDSSLWPGAPPMLRLCRQAEAFSRAVWGASSCSTTTVVSTCLASFLACKGTLAETIVGSPSGRFSTWCSSWASASHSAWIARASSGFADPLNQSCFNASCSMQQLFSNTSGGGSSCSMDVPQICAGALSPSSLPLSQATQVPFSGMVFSNQLVVSVDVEVALQAALGASGIFVRGLLPAILQNASLDDLLSLQYTAFASYGLARLLSVFAGLPPNGSTKAAADMQFALDGALGEPINSSIIYFGSRNATVRNSHLAVTVSVPSSVPAFPRPKTFVAVLSVTGAFSLQSQVIHLLSSWILSKDGSSPLDVASTLGITSVVAGGIDGPDSDPHVVVQYAVAFMGTNADGGVPLLYFFFALIGAALTGFCIGLFFARFFLRPLPLPSFKQQLLDVPLLAT
jgi:hypothetical protein